MNRLKIIVLFTSPCLLLIPIKGALCAEANQKCTGNPRMYNGTLCASTTRYSDGNTFRLNWCAVCGGEPEVYGKSRMYNGTLCASTTRYSDGNKDACGCGPSENNDQFPWNFNGFVAAANQALFDRGGATWCGESCGKCIKLTTTGGFVDGQGKATDEGQSEVFIITNLCPNTYPNLSWCSQQESNGGVNQYGYGAHFDLQDVAYQISDMGWDNPEVTWEWADCDDGHWEDERTPNNDMYQTCQCGNTENE